MKDKTASKKQNITYVLTEEFHVLLQTYIKEIDAIDLLILAKVYFFTTSTSKKECIVGDSTFAYELGIADRSVRRRIKTMVDLGLLDREVYFESGQGATSKIRKLKLSSKALEALGHRRPEHPAKNGSSVRPNNVEALGHRWPISSISSSYEEDNSSNLSSKDANASIGANAPCTQSTQINLNSLEAEVSSLLDSYGFGEVSSKTIDNIKKWCNESCKKFNCESNEFNAVVLSNTLTFKSEDLKKTFGRDAAYKFGVLKNVILNSYGDFMNKAISYRYEQEEQMRELQESRRSIQYRYDCRTHRGSDERQNNIGEILEDVM